MIHANSHAAYAAHDETSRREQILVVLASAKRSVTCQELLTEMHRRGMLSNRLDLNQVRPTVTRLLQAGVVAEDGERTDPDSGLTNRCFRLAPVETAGTAQDLISLGAVVGTGTGDRAALGDLIRDHGFAAVQEACTALRGQIGRRPFVSQVEARLVPAKAGEALIGPALAMALGRAVAARLLDEGVTVRASWQDFGGRLLTHGAALMVRLRQWARCGWLQALTDPLLLELCDGRKPDIEPLPAKAWTPEQADAWARDQLTKITAIPAQAAG